ncbi:MAG: bifunctional fructose-bisphosphatase/inositol-phosphate phosphatase [Methanobacteriaceae archaeon]|nr:bifunctional fructose-bisphosphatase/inositol-phosphate phosphatase [Methanobacteriaceae archaeon]
MKKDDLNFWKEVSKKIIKNVENAISPYVGTKKANKIVMMGADGTPTKLIDIKAETEVIKVLKELEIPVTLISEEIGMLNLGDEPSTVYLVVDPLDGTTNAVKNMPAYGISIAIAKTQADKYPTINNVNIGFVKNFATGDLFRAVKGQGSFINDQKAVPSTIDKLNNSLVGAFIYGTNVKKLDYLCKRVRRMRIMGSVAIELCYVADMTYDAFIDLRDNLRIVDIAAAKLIVEEAGGIVSDLDNQTINGKLTVKDKTSILAASNKKLHEDILNVMGGL